MVKLFTDIDLDGLGCGLIAKIAFGDKADVSYCSYRNLNQRVEAFIENPHQEQLFITDLAVNSDVEKKLADRAREGKHVRVIDHHVTAMHFNQYEWGIVKPEYENGKKTCAASLFYDYLLEHKLIKKNQALEDFIEFVRQYDTWEWEVNDNPEAKRLNDLFYIMSREKFEEEMLKRLTANTEFFKLNQMENMLLDLEDSKIERYINSKSRQIVQSVIDEFYIGIVYAEQYVSELGNSLNKIYPHLDMIALLNIGGKKIGFRTIHDHVNAAEYAKRYGGGGHPKASGCDMTQDAFDKFVINVFNLPSLKPDPERNQLNIKDAGYAASYQNSSGELSYIIPESDGAYQIIHKGKKMGEVFHSYREAENHLKRNFGAYLRMDQECIRQLAISTSLPIDEIREKYGELINSSVKS